MNGLGGDDALDQRRESLQLTRSRRSVHRPAIRAKRRSAGSRADPGAASARSARKPRRSPSTGPQSVPRSPNNLRSKITEEATGFRHRHAEVFQGSLCGPATKDGVALAAVRARSLGEDRALSLSAVLQPFEGTRIYRLLRLLFLPVLGMAGGLLLGLGAL